MELKYCIIRRLFLVIPVLIGVSLLVFVILSLFSPAQRAAAFITDIKQLRNIEGVIRTHHLDAPIYIQYFYWIVEVFRGNLGWSKTAERPVLEALSGGYITTARAKGADEATVIKKHARKNAMIPVVTVSGYIFAWMMQGVVITETIFNRKGLGWWWARAAVQLDIPAILGAVLFSGLLFVLTNLVVDLIYAYLDPRVRLG